MTESLNREQQEADFREFHAEHLRRQTAAIETIRSILMTWAILTALGAVIIVVAAVGQGY